MLGSCSILIRKAPAQEEAILGFRAAWAMFSNANLDMKIFLMGDGVYSAFLKGYAHSLLQRFIEADGEAYAIEEDVKARGIESMPEGVRVIPAADVPGLLEDTESIMSF